MKQALINWLKLPEADSIDDLDAPAALAAHYRIIRTKTFLQNVYRANYSRFKNILGDPSGAVRIVELGSGSGFIKEIIPSAITSDILQVSSVDVTFSGEQIPFKDASIDAFLMIDVFHHVKKARAFLLEMQRCLKPNGKIIMIEPANSAWGRFIWINFHHEQFDPKGGWTIEGVGPMSDANGALPWIVFARDRKIFEQDFPGLSINTFKTHTPLGYLISGGLTIKQLLPGFCYPLIQGLEFILTPLNRWLGMFYLIEISKAGKKAA